MIHLCAVNSEANARRIALVEGCFGTSGQPLGVPGKTWNLAVLPWKLSCRPSFSRWGSFDKSVQKKTKAQVTICGVGESSDVYVSTLQTGNSSSSMICSSMETLWSTRKSTTNRWTILLFDFHIPTFSLQHLIPLEEVKLKSLEDEGQFKNGWLLCTRWNSDFYIWERCKYTDLMYLTAAALILTIDWAGASPLQCLLQLQQKSRSGWRTSTSVLRWFAPYVLFTTDPNFQKTIILA